MKTSWKPLNLQRVVLFTLHVEVDVDNYGDHHLLAGDASLSVHHGRETCGGGGCTTIDCGGGDTYYMVWVGVASYRNECRQ